MNFPPILFNNEKFPSLLSQNHSQTESSIISFQNLCKKLLKYENKESNFEQSIISWIKSLDLPQLLKYFSFKNHWLVDILHEMILINSSKPYIKFKFIPSPSQSSSSEKEPQDTKPLISCLNFLFFNKESPKFSDYFNIVDEGLVLLTRGKSEGEQRRQELVDSIRYVTLNSRIQNYNEEKNIFYNEYNNVVTLYYDYLKDIDKVISTFQDISNKQCFKYPIEIETETYSNDSNSKTKNYYNFKMPKWLKKEFTFSELFCAYLEQCIIINFMYYKMYKSEISILHYEQFDELIENNKKLIEFIKNRGEKKFEIIRNLRPDEIKKIVGENQNIKQLICKKMNKDSDIRSSYIGKYSYPRKHTMKTIINSCITTLEKLFIRGEVEFVLYLNFFKDNIIFTTDDFVIKTIADIINNYWKSKAAEDLLNDLNNNNNDGNNKKKKKKKKKKKEKNAEKNNEMENDNSKNTNNINIEIDNNIINEGEKNEEINVNKDNEIKNEIENDLNKDQSDIIITKEIKEENKIENTNIEDSNIISEKDNNIKIENKDNIISNNNTTENGKFNKKKKEKDFFLYPAFKDNNKKRKNKHKNKINSKENENKKENEEENNINESKKENVKDTIIEDINEKTEEIIIDNINENIIENINENNDLNNNIIISNIEDDNRTDLSTDKATSSNTKEEEDKIFQNEIIMEILENTKEKKKEKSKKEHNKSEYEYTETKQKNKFNMKIKKLMKDNSNLIIPKNFHPRDSNHKYQKYGINQISFQSKIEDMYNNTTETDPGIDINNYIMGSNKPHFTSFNFQSKKKRNYKNKHWNNNQMINSYNNFVPKNIMEFGKEIIDNTMKVNNNKKLLQQIREKYIKKVYENINIILRNSKVEFQCSFYGSSVSGLSIENSDIDIMVKLRKDYKEKEYINNTMNILVENLKKSELNYIKNILPISSASVPVIKLACDLSKEPSFLNEINSLIKNNDIDYNDISKLFFDITFFETENELEKIPSELMLDYIKDCTLLYPQIFDIVYIMKRFLFNTKLNKSYQGGISSYSLFLMTLAFIKSYKNNYEIPIGSLFIEYLYFYSNFNFYNTLIQPSKENNNIFEKIENNNLQKYNMNIIDPITGLNVAKSTFKIEHIQNAFRKGFDNISSSIFEMNFNNLNENNIPEHNKILDNFFSLK